MTEDDFRKLFGETKMVYIYSITVDVRKILLKCFRRVGKQRSVYNYIWQLQTIIYLLFELYYKNSNVIEKYINQLESQNDDHICKLDIVYWAYWKDALLNVLLVKLLECQ